MRGGTVDQGGRGGRGERGGEERSSEGVGEGEG